MLQALRRLIVFGFQSDARTLEPVPVVTQTVPVLLQALQTLLAARPAKGAPRSQLAVMLDRGLIKLAKVITNVQEAHPWYFTPKTCSLCFFAEVPQAVANTRPVISGFAEIAITL